MARAVSTVLDVAVCLLLVGVAVVTLTAAVPDGGATAPDGGDRAAAELGTVTAGVEADGTTRHDTLAGHLARAAVANATVDGQPVVETEYPDAVAEAVRSRSGERIHVTARWRPLGDEPISGAVTAGREPPRTAEVSVTAYTVGSGLRIPDGTDEPEAALANAYVAWLFPPERTRARLVDSRTAPVASDRYTNAATRLETTVAGPLADADAGRVNERLEAALAARLSEANEGHGEIAGRDVPPTEVELIVRRWKP